MTLAVALSVLVGIALGMLGGGGSILTIPILTYVAGLPPKQAITTSLFVVTITSAAALVTHARRGMVEWRSGLAFGAAGMVGAYLGGRASSLLPGHVLLTGFGLMMLATALAMLRRPSPPGATATSLVPCPAPSRAASVKMAVRGLAVGTLTGLLGAGGGFLIVPALVLLAGMSMRRAVATSLLVIAMQSLSGLLGHMHETAMPWSLAFAVTGAAVLGSVAGGYFSTRVSAPALRKGFGWMVAAMALVVLALELRTSW